MKVETELKCVLHKCVQENRERKILTRKHENENTENRIDKKHWTQIVCTVYKTNSSKAYKVHYNALWVDYSMDKHRNVAYLLTVYSYKEWVGVYSSY